MKKILMVTVATVLAISASAQANRLVHTSPESMGMDGTKLQKIDSVMNHAVAAEEIPGGVVAVVRDDKIVYLKAFGNKQIVPSVEPMTTETIFDMASLSKCVGTTLSFMQLVEQGLVGLDDDVRHYLPDFAPWVDPKNPEHKVHITVQNLLTHTSGLDAYINVASFSKSHPDIQSRPDSLIHFIATEVGRNFEPGTDTRYSCLNFVTLQNILQVVTGQKLCDYAQKNVFDRLGLEHTCYFPIGTKIDKNTLAMIAPTEVQKNGKPYRGEVHDPIANLLNLGNSGNAGVFSCAEDLAVVACAMMNGGECNGRRVLAPMTVKRMLGVPYGYPEDVERAIGWDNSYYASARGDLFPRETTFHHTGYTGTSLCFDTDSKTAVIVLTNRVHPNDGGAVSRTRWMINNIVAGSILK